MRYSLNKKEKKRITICVTAVAVALVIAGIVFYFLDVKKEVEKRYEGQIQELKDEMTANKRSVYRTLRDIRAGEKIDPDADVEEVIVFSEEASDRFASADVFSRQILIDIPEGTLLHRTYFAESNVEQGVMEVQYNYIDVTSNISVNDYVDIRILYSDGSEEIVISKTQIKGLADSHLTVELWLTEAEQQMMNSAATDAAIDSIANLGGAKIYAKKYINPTSQAANTVTYVPSVQTINLIKNSPNVNIASLSVDYLSTELRKQKESTLAVISAGTSVLGAEGEIVVPDTLSDIVANLLVDSSTGEEIDDGKKQEDEDAKTGGSVTGVE